MKSHLRLERRRGALVSSGLGLVALVCGLHSAYSATSPNSRSTPAPGGVGRIYGSVPRAALGCPDGPVPSAICRPSRLISLLWCIDISPRWHATGAVRVAVRFGRI